MNILQNYYILNQLDVPTIEWQQYFSTSVLNENLLWTIKIEENGSSLQVKEDEERKKEQQQKKPNDQKPFFEKIKEKIAQQDKKEKAQIGVSAYDVKAFVKRNEKYLSDRELFIYYPYYTVVQSGIIDMNYDRTVIEATKGNISNLVKHNNVDITMIFREDDLIIEGQESLFTKEEMLPLIDYSKNVRKMVAKDIDQGKNIQLYFSFFYQTNVMLKPEGEKKVLFYKFKLF